MQNNFKITVPEPCHENWDAMLPETSGRFCSNCSKSVIDFTEMNSQAINDYFLKLNGKSVCGRFKDLDRNTISINLEIEKLSSAQNFQKLFFIALFICMGTTLLSCTDNDGNKQKIESVEIEDQSKIHVTMGIPSIDSIPKPKKIRKVNPALENATQDSPVTSNGKVIFLITKDSLTSE